jgi:hypothetical protein
VRRMTRPVMLKNPNKRRSVPFKTRKQIRQVINNHWELKE